MPPAVLPRRGWAKVGPRLQRAPLVLALVVALFASYRPGHATPGAAPIRVSGEYFIDAEGRPTFVLGANYEGPANWAWQQWHFQGFNPVFIEEDFRRAREANLSVLRTFVRQELADDIRAGRWRNLDWALDLADRHGLQIILTFADYPEGELANLAAIDRAVGSRYRDRPTLFAYDLKNEPRFRDLALARYPLGYYVALQDSALVAQVGESIPRAEIGGYRLSEAGSWDIPEQLTDEQAYVYANLLGAYRRFLQDAGVWAQARGASTVRYMLSPDSEHWKPLKEALNDTLATWIKVRLDALEGADPDRLVTIGHVDPIIASLPANNWLDYRAFHRYPSASSAGIQVAMALFDDVRAALPGKPLMMGEFGFSNVNVDEQRSASLEVEMVQAVRERGGAGALKWMLNDFPRGFNPRENNFGLYRGDGSAKPVVAAFRELGVLTPAAPRFEPRPEHYDMAGGHFFTQTNGKPAGVDPSGFAVTNADGVPFWDIWGDLGLENVGYPISSRLWWRGFLTQVFQKAVFQWKPGEGVALVNIFDELHVRGLDPVLRTRSLVPPQAAFPDEAAKSWEEVIESRLALLGANPAIEERYRAAPDPLLLYGLPTSAVEDLGDLVVVRTQRTVLQQWKTEQPWARAGEVTVGNAGEIAKELGLFPVGPLVPEPPPPLGGAPAGGP